MKRTLFVLALLLCVCVGAGAEPHNRSSSLRSGRVRVKQLARDFSYYAPARLSDSPKLVFVLHGSGMTAIGMRLASGHQFDRLADTYGDMVIVYPQGYGRYWNDCRVGGTYDAKKMNVDDVGFFAAMIRFFRENYHIDTTRVFVTGYSNGAQMCFKLAKESPGLFRGFASVGANLPVETNNDCKESGEPVSMLMINGTSDPVNPYDGGKVKAGDGKQRGDVISTSRTLQYWIHLAGGDSVVAKEYDYPDTDTKDKSTAVRYTYDCTQTGKTVVLLKVIHGGHIFMNDGFRYWPRVLGNVNRDIDAPTVIIDFFRGLS